MLRILQARFQQYVNCELPGVQLDLEKAEEPEIKLPTSIGLLIKQESSRKTSTSALLWRSKWQPTPVFLPGESHGWRSLVLQRVRHDSATSLSLSFILNLIKAILRRTKLEISYCLISNYTTKL